MEKMTNKKALEFVLENCVIPEDVKEKLEKMLVQVEKKNASGGAKAEKALTEKVALANAVYAFMEVNTKYTCTEILKNCEECKELSGPKVTSVLYYMIDCGMVTNVKEKGKSYFVKVVA